MIGYKALDSHYEEIEEDAKAIAKENEELKAQNKDLCVSLDIMNNRESELLDQIEKMKCCGNCKHWRHEGIQKYCVATKPDFLIKRRKDICDKWELAE